VWAICPPIALKVKHIAFRITDLCLSEFSKMMGMAHPTENAFVLFEI